MKDAVKQDLSVSYYDENHVQIGEMVLECLGPRMHVSSTGKIEDFTLVKDYPIDPGTGYYMLVGRSVSTGLRICQTLTALT